MRVCVCVFEGVLQEDIQLEEKIALIGFAWRGASVHGRTRV